MKVKVRRRDEEGIVSTYNAERYRQIEYPHNTFLYLKLEGYSMIINMDDIIYWTAED